MNRLLAFIFLKPLDELQGCSTDEEFFKSKTWEETSQQIPDPDWSGKIKDQEAYWNKIKAYVDLQKRYAGLINYH